MGVVRVYQGRSGPKLRDEAGEHPRVEPDGPGDRAHADAIPLQALGELTPGARHDHLPDALLREGARQPPDLTLAAAPLAS